MNNTQQLVLSIISIIMSFLLLVVTYYLWINSLTIVTLCILILWLSIVAGIYTILKYFLF